MTDQVILKAILEKFNPEVWVPKIKDFIYSSRLTFKNFPSIGPNIMVIISLNHYKFEQNNMFNAFNVLLVLN